MGSFLSNNAVGEEWRTHGSSGEPRERSRFPAKRRDGFSRPDAQLVSVRTGGRLEVAGMRWFLVRRFPITSGIRFAMYPAWQDVTRGDGICGYADGVADSERLAVYS